MNEDRHNEVAKRPAETVIGRRRGNLSNWSNAASKLFAGGCESMSVALLASFAAPLMEMQPRGCVLSLVDRGPRRTSPKGAVLGAARSVWPERIDLVDDQLELRDPELVRKKILSVASVYNPRLLISASNGSIVEAMGDHTAADYIFELPLEMPDHLRGVIGDKLGNELVANAGHAGDAFARWLDGSRDWAKAALNDYTKQIRAETGLPPDYDNCIYLAGALAVSSLVVAKLGLIEFSPSRITNWLIAAMRKRAGLDERREDGWQLKMLHDFITRHEKGVLVMLDKYALRRPNRIVRYNRGRLIMRYEVNTRRLMIATAPLRNWLAERNVRQGVLLEYLVRRGICAKRRPQNRLAAGSGIASKLQVCIEINMRHQDMQGIDPGKNNPTEPANHRNPAPQAPEADQPDGAPHPQ